MVQHILTNFVRQIPGVDPDEIPLNPSLPNYKNAIYRSRALWMLIRQRTAVKNSHATVLRLYLEDEFGTPKKKSVSGDNKQSREQQRQFRRRQARLAKRPILPPTPRRSTTQPYAHLFVLPHNAGFSHHFLASCRRQIVSLRKLEAARCRIASLCILLIPVFHTNRCESIPIDPNCCERVRIDPTR